MKGGNSVFQCLICGDEFLETDFVAGRRLSPCCGGPYEETFEASDEEREPSNA